MLNSLNKDDSVDIYKLDSFINKNFDKFKPNKVLDSNQSISKSADITAITMSKCGN